MTTHSHLFDVGMQFGEFFSLHSTQSLSGHLLSCTPSPTSPPTPPPASSSAPSLRLPQLSLSLTLLTITVQATLKVVVTAMNSNLLLGST